MLIDWFTVGAQALNFILLVWLLKRFLYRPILEAVDLREKRIAAELADAETKKVEAQKEHAEFQLKSEQFDHQRAALLAQATQEVNVERQRLLAEASSAADALAAKRRKALRSDADNLNQAIRLRTQQEVFAIARKSLADLAASSLEERMADVFIRRLRMLNGSAKDTLSEALKTGSEPALVRSAFELPGAQRSALQSALKEIFSLNVNVLFEVAPELICGIDLSANGQKITWNIADYLVSLEKSLADLLCEDTLPDSQAVTESAEPVATPKRLLAEAASS